MKNIKKSVLIMLACVVLICALCFGGCVQLANGDIYVTNVSVSQTVDGTEYEITVEYSDGNNNTYRIPAAEKGDNGADGKPGEDGKPGSDGQDGEDGKDITITEIYNKYVEEYGEISYADFLKEYFPVIHEENNVGMPAVVADRVYRIYRIQCGYARLRYVYVYRLCGNMVYGRQLYLFCYQLPRDLQLGSFIRAQRRRYRPQNNGLSLRQRINAC